MGTIGHADTDLADAYRALAPAANPRTERPYAVAKDVTLPLVVSDGTPYLAKDPDHDFRCPI